MSAEDAPETPKTEQTNQEPGFRVYVGNISFKTKPADLKQSFSEVGNVQRAKVAIHRSGRRLGFGFVTFDTEESAKKAIEQKTGTELDGRTIRVEVATATKRKPKTRKSKKSGSKSETESTSEAETSTKKVSEKKPREKTPKAPRVKVPISEREISENIVYVAGLKDETTEEEVTALLAEYGVKTVTLRRAYRGKDQPRALFAFVYVDGAENQQKIVDQFEGKDFQGETLIVKKAFKQPTKAPRPARSPKSDAPASKAEKPKDERPKDDKPKDEKSKTEKPKRTRKPKKKAAAGSTTGAATATATATEGEKKTETSS